MHDVKTYTETSCIVNIRNLIKPDLVAIVNILKVMAIFSALESLLRFAPSK